MFNVPFIKLADWIPTTPGAHIAVAQRDYDNSKVGFTAEKMANNTTSTTPDTAGEDKRKPGEIRGVVSWYADHPDDFRADEFDYSDYKPWEYPDYSGNPFGYKNNPDRAGQLTRRNNTGTPGISTNWAMNLVPNNYGRSYMDMYRNAKRDGYFKPGSPRQTASQYVRNYNTYKPISNLYEK